MYATFANTIVHSLATQQAIWCTACVHIPRNHDQRLGTLCGDPAWPQLTLALWLNWMAECQQSDRFSKRLSDLKCICACHSFRNEIVYMPESRLRFFFTLNRAALRHKHGNHVFYLQRLEQVHPQCSTITVQSPNQGFRQLPIWWRAQQMQCQPLCDISQLDDALRSALWIESAASCLICQLRCLCASLPHSRLFLAVTNIWIAGVYF